MLRHIVLIKFKDGVDSRSVAIKFKKMLEELENSIVSLIRIEVGINISTKPSAHDIVLTADFNDIDGLDNYRIHPEHVKVLEYLKTVMDKVAVVDYIN